MGKKMHFQDVLPSDLVDVAIPANSSGFDIADESAYQHAMSVAMESAVSSPERKPSFLFTGANPRFENRQRIKGVVKSTKMNKTIVVSRDLVRPDPKYKKLVKKTSTFYAHDEYNLAKIGDTVLVVECRPISKTKRFLLESIVFERTILHEKLPFSPNWIKSPPLILLLIPQMVPDGEQELVANRSYEVILQLEREQLPLFEDDLSFDGNGEIEILGPGSQPSVKKSAPSRAELEVRFVSATLNVEPRSALVRSIEGNPRIEPSLLKLTALTSGIAELNVSVISRRSGEVVQTQSFEFKIK